VKLTGLTLPPLSDVNTPQNFSQTALTPGPPPPPLHLHLYPQPQTQVSLSTEEMKPVAPTETNDPYGIATIPLSDLLAGSTRVLSLECPVLPGNLQLFDRVFLAFGIVKAHCSHSVIANGIDRSSSLPSCLPQPPPQPLLASSATVEVFELRRLSTSLCPSILHHLTA
jgi:hypothetical protein